MMDNRDIYRNQRRAFRQQTRYRRRGVFGGFNGLLWVIIIIVAISNHLWFLFPLAFFGFPLFFFLSRPRFSGGNWSMNQQQQPYNQPYQQPVQPEQPVYQPYTQGYQPQQTPAQPRETYEEAGQQYQYPTQQNTQQQYEEPLTMYPQE